MNDTVSEVHQGQGRREEYFCRKPLVFNLKDIDCM